MDNVSYNSVLAALNVNQHDKIVLIKENKLADANFIVTHLMKQIFADRNNKICLVNLHNAIKHYVTVGKRLGYDLQKRIDDGYVRLVEPIKSISDDLNTHYMRFINNDSEKLIGYLFKNIESEINGLIGNDDDINVYLIIDDLSHLLDMNAGINHILSFINTCINMERVSTIVNCHVASKLDELLANSLEYLADVKVEVSELKTGRSVDVTGYMSVVRPSCDKASNNYHFKAYDRGIRMFKPGETLKFL